MRGFWFGLKVGVFLGALAVVTAVATAQPPTRVYGTYNGQPIPLAATAAGYLSTTGTP